LANPPLGTTVGMDKTKKDSLPQVLLLLAFFIAMIGIVNLAAKHGNAPLGLAGVALAMSITAFVVTAVTLHWFGWLRYKAPRRTWSCSRASIMPFVLWVLSVQIVVASSAAFRDHSPAFGWVLIVLGFALGIFNRTAVRRQWFCWAPFMVTK
jgi:hypothetical protein